jgi:hypothetical protein
MPSPESVLLASLSFEAEVMEAGAPDMNNLNEDDDDNSLRMMAEVDRQNQRRSPSTNVNNANNNNHRQQGVLWKRRDVFKNRWRPRWFVLHPGQGVLTYYLLSSSSNNNHGHRTAIVRQSSTPVSTNSNFSSRSATLTPSRIPSQSSNANRRRTLSETSSNTTDYDVVPRGMIALLGCTVTVDEENSRPEEDLFAFKINPPSHSTEVTCYLAARTAASRSQWMACLRRASQTPVRPSLFLSSRSRGTSSSLSSTTSNTNTSTTATTNSTNILNPSPHRHNTTTTRSISSNNSAMLSPIRSLSMPVTPVVASSSSPFHAVNVSDDIPHTASTPTRRNNSNTHLRQQRTTTTPLSDDTPGVMNNYGGWMTLEDDSPHNLWESVPPSLQTKLEQTLAEYLPILSSSDDHSSSNNGWKLLFDKDGLVASTRQHDRNGRRLLLLQSQALVDHPPMQILNLLLDSSRRPQYEPNVRYDRRLHVYNPHTRLDYSAYHAVWPTTARDFAVALQWRVVVNPTLYHRHNEANKERGSAILLLATSCAQADTLQPPQSNHVRAHLEVSLNLLEAIGTTKCRQTRLLSYDLMGSIPTSITNRVMMQQANLPKVLDLFLTKSEPIVPARFQHPLSNQVVIQEIINPIVYNKPLPKISSDKQQEQQQRQQVQVQVQEQEHDSIIITEEQQPSMQCAQTGQRSVVLLAIVLAIPVILFKYVGGSILTFLISAWFAIRWVILAQLSSPLRRKVDLPPESIISCRFTVTLKAGAAIHDKHQKLQSVTALTTRILVTALQKFPELQKVSLSIPFFWIDGYIESSARKIGIVLPESSQLISIQSPEHKTVQDISTLIDDSNSTSVVARRNAVLEPYRLILTVQDSSMDMDARVKGVPITALVSCSDIPTPKSKSGSSSLAISLTFSGPVSVMKCREFSEHVQKLFPSPKR